jgi:hypothetical protein
MESIFSALAPNGYLELQHICFPCKSPDGTLEGTSLQKSQTSMVGGLRKLGKGFEKWSMVIITRGMGWRPEEVEALLAEVRSDVKNYRNIHACVQM